MKISILALLPCFMFLYACSSSSAGESAPQAEEYTSSRQYEEVYVIGDSISIHSLGYLCTSLAESHTVSHCPGNGKTSEWILEHMDSWMDGRRPEVIIFNCGLHDISTASSYPDNAIPISQYEVNLRTIVLKLKNLSWHPRLIWATTTPVIDSMRSDRKNADVVAYNEAADRVMEASGIQKVDLYTTMLPHAEYSLDGVHFSQEGCALIGETMGGAVLQ